jgi:amino acid adenylation domain-containing protein/FkbM family methyltransferase
MQVQSPLTVAEKERLLKLAKSFYVESKTIALPPILAAGRGKPLPLSFAQQRLWFIAQQIKELGRAYHIFYGWQLQGRLDRRALRQALDRIVTRHEALRTTFISIDDEPWQRITRPEESSFHLLEHDLLGSPSAASDLDSLVREEASTGFDLENGPLVRGRLIRTGQKDHALLISMHHIVSDGWSMGIFINELSELYGAFARGEDDPLPALDVQYADYAVWQRKWMGGELLRKQGKFWETNLAGAPALLELPMDHSRPAKQDYSGGWVKFVLEKELTRDLRDLSKRCGTTLYMTLLAGWATVLSRLSGQEDIVIGTPVANRGQVETEALIGFFVNMLAIRVDLSESPSVGELLRRVKAQTLSAQENQDIPFEQVVDIARPVRSLSHTPLFQVGLSLQKSTQGAAPFPGLELRTLPSAIHRVAKLDLALSLHDSGERIVGGLEYATALFEEETVVRYLGFLRTVLEAMVADSTQSLDRLSLLSVTEWTELVHGCNRSEAEYPREKCLEELFEDQVEKTPDAIAAVMADGALTYRELDRRANQLAHQLRQQDVRAEKTVAICVERSLAMLVGVLGTWKAGAAYVPLDPEYPTERLKYMLEHSAPNVLLSERSVLERLQGISVPVLELNDVAGPESGDEQRTAERPDRAAGTERLAYVIYTSGSTGLPKGVMVQQRSVVNLFAGLKNSVYRNSSAGLRVAVNGPMAFDTSVKQIIQLLAGHTLEIVPEAVRRDGDALLALLRERQIQVLDCTPTQLRLLMEAGLAPQSSASELERLLTDAGPVTQEKESLSQVLVGGEAIEKDLWETLAGSNTEFFNVYGPTECTVDASVCAVHESEEPSIGRPIANTMLYVLSGDLEPVPRGVAGELYIGGEGVARGYWHDPGATAARFIADPFRAAAGARLYRTGDRVRRLSDGKLAFLGRSDDQVKIRGFRVELGEIEARLAEHEDVEEAVVLLREDVAGDKRLVAYYTSANEGEQGAGPEQLRTHLAGKLPDYMVPAAYVRLSEFPITPNGKLDRKSLLAPDADALGVRAYEPPQGEAEAALAAIWADLLKLDRVGRNDNFFELGGNSLLVVQVIARMRRSGWHVDLQALFATPVLSELASAIRPNADTSEIQVPANRIAPGSKEIKPEDLPLVHLTAEDIERIVAAVPGGAANVQDVYPLAPLQEGILFHHLMGKESDPYILGSLYTFESRERLDSYLRALQSVIARHDILRTAVLWDGFPEPVQVVWRHAILPVEEVQLEIGAGDAAQQLYKLYDPRSCRIDVRRAPLLRVAIAYDAEQKRWLMMQLRHHLAGDHTTHEVIQEEIQAHLLGREDRLPEPLQFRSLVAQARLGISQEEHEAFFRRLLGDVEEPTAPFGLLNVQGDGTGIDQARIQVEAGVARRIREIARKLGVSAATLCHVAWALVLARACGREDVVFGTVLFGRMQGGPGSERVMGVYLNTLPVRICAGQQSVEQSVRDVHQQLAELLRHEHASLALAQRCSAVPAPTPLFSSLLNYRHNPGAAQALSEEKTRAWNGIQGLYADERTNYPVSLDVDDLNEVFRIKVQVDTSVDAHRVCRYMHTALESLVNALENDPSCSLQTLEIIPETERQQVVYEWNATSGDYPRQSCAHQLFEEQVERTPEAVAVVFEDTALSYRGLNRRANQLAHYLRKLAVGPETRVAICTDRGPEMVMGLLAVWKAGGAYVPLDPGYPAERLQYMLRDSAPAVALTQKRRRDLLTAVSAEAPLLDLDDASPWQDQPESNPSPHAQGESSRQLAYLIYTSGSTGVPKGAMIQQGGLVNHLAIMIRDLQLTPEDTVVQTASQCFDISVWQLVTALLVGGKVLIVSDDETHDPEALLRRLDRSAATVWETVPAMLEAMIGDVGWLGNVLHGMRWVLVTGEAAPVSLGRRWKKIHSEIPLLNAYGPAECSDDVSFYLAADEPSGSATQYLPIGRPLMNLQIYVLDSNGVPAPVGVNGEIYVGGDGVGRGYWVRPEMTAEKFIADEFSNHAGARLYRTGDLGRWNKNQQLEFLGRIDHQVKVRGYRIELEEIEAKLVEHEEVREAVVILREDTPGHPQLVAYYTSTEVNSAAGDTARVEQLRNHLRAKLPEYMVPAAYVRLEKLPLTRNGKVDRKGLPAPDTGAFSARGYEEPVGEIELALASAWSELLKVDKVGRNNHFFELGGHSLLIVRLISRIRKTLNAEMMIRHVFDHPVLADLAAVLRTATQAAVPPIMPVERELDMPLSFAQQRLWFLAQMGASEAYHIFSGWRLHGPLDEDALQHALDVIVSRHEPLRTTFSLIDGDPVQRIASAEQSRFALVCHDLSNHDGAAKELHRLIWEEARAPFDLEKGPLIRGRLIRTGDEEHALLITMHHIVSDGWSESILMKELSALYRAFARGAENPLPPLEVQYADYAVWQRNWMEGDVLRKQAEYWEKTLAGAPALLELPTDHPRPLEQDYSGGRIAVVLNQELTRGLKELSKKHGTTLYMTLLAGWAALLSRLSGQEDVVIGTPVANRGQVETEGLIGLFVNTLALRLDLSGAPNTGELLQRVKDQTLAAQQHQDVPFEQIVEIAHPVRSLSHTPVFQVMFDWQQNVAGERLRLERLELSPLGHQAHLVAKFDLTLSLLEADERIVGWFKYATALYEQSTVERYLDYLRTLLQAMVAQEAKPINDLQIMPQAELDQVLQEWNATRSEYQREKCVHALFEEQVEKTPDSPAVAFGESLLSYGELNRRANQLAHYLRELGVRPEVRVGICLERRLEMMVALLGVLKAGGAYVPLDPGYPVERLRYMVEDSQPLVVLTQGESQHLFSGLTQEPIRLDMEGSYQWQAHAETNPERIEVGLRPESIAYVIYTSGSTGAPKGVAVPHSGLTNVLNHLQTEFAIGAEDVVLATTTLSFDIAVLELYLPVIRGAYLRIASSEAKRNPALLLEELERGITLLQLTPTGWQMLLESGWQGTRGLRPLSGGEALGSDLARNLVRRCGLVWNFYGPTETTVYSASEKLVEVGDRVALGKALANTQIYILDRHGEPVPAGVAGEIYIGGDGVARGYLNRPELTAERFVNDPFFGYGARIYKTGDVGRWNGGKLEFLGRNDSQVKLRGYRIELPEIEARLAEHEQVQDAVIMIREDTAGDKRLVAYYTAVEATGGTAEMPGAEQLRKHLASTLPEYMVPAAYVRLEKFPLTPNAKVDRKALPAPELAAYPARGDDRPQGEVETMLAEIWAEVLKLERVGRHDNFFETGGNSLLAIRLIQRMRRSGLEVDVRTLFAMPTLSELATAVSLRTNVVDIDVPPNLIPPESPAITPEMLPLVRLTAEEIQRIIETVPGGAPNVQDIYPLTPLQEGILFHHLMGGEGDPYILANLYSFQTRERLESYLEAMQAVIARHDILRTAVLWEGMPEPLQVVWRKATLPVEEVTLDRHAGDPVRHLYARYGPRACRIDVRQAPLLRVIIAHDEAEDRWLMMQLQHHLVGDHVTLEIMQEEMQAYLLGRVDQLPPPLPFRNMVVRVRLGVSQEEHEKFFRQLLGDVEEPTAPFGLLNVHGDGTGIDMARMRVDARLARRIRERARRLGVSSASLCHMAWALVIARTTGRDDVVFGTVLFGRMQAGEGADRAMGLFMNTLPVRIRVGEQGAAESVRTVHKLLAELLRHEHASLALAQRCSAVPAPTPLFSSLLNYRHNTDSAEVRQEEKVRAWEGIQSLYGDERNNYPLNLAVTEIGDSFRMTVHVERTIKAQRICEYMHTALESLVDALENQPARPLGDLNVMPAAEREQMVYGWNQTEAEYPRESCVHHLFEDAAAKTPDAIAVACEDVVLSYGELSRRANRLAHYLREMGVGPDQRVAICLERSVEMIVSVLGVWKAGGAYVPLDPAYPAERLNYMLEHSAPSVLLTQSKHLGRWNALPGGVKVIDVAEAAAPGDARPENNPDSTTGAGGQNLAYMIYTSGSTGLSKGVMVKHQSVVNLFMGLKNSVYQGTSGQNLRISMNGSMSFDTSVKQIIQLLAGHSLEIVPEAIRRDGETLLSFLRERQIEVLDCTPSQLLMLLNCGLAATSSDSHLDRLLAEAGLQPEQRDSLATMLVGGEAIEKSMWESLASSPIAFFNVYGPTECTVDASVCSVRSAEVPSIGGPIANTRLHVLDAHLDPAPLGVSGELCIEGDGVARGYWNDPATTAKKFVPNPFSATPGARLYRTGDRVCRLADGKLAFLGRTDEQVKIRGYRVEPNEVASVLEQHPAVRQAVVSLRPDQESPQFVAHVVLEERRSPTIGGRQRYQLPNKLAVVHLNRNETEFLYHEMFEIQAYFKHGISLHDGACVFDVGANIGLFSLSAHLRAKDVRIYAFEPSPDVFNLLKTNLELYSVDARLYQAGVSNKKKSMPLTFYPKFSFLSGLYADRDDDKQVVRSFIRKHDVDEETGSQTVLVEELLEDRFESRQIEVDLMTISGVLKETQAECVDLLKVNVEKSEMDVLAGIEESDWPRIRQIAMEVHDIDGRLNQVVELLSRHGYSVAVEQDWQLEESTKTNFYVYARREDEASDAKTATPASVADELVTARELRAFAAKHLPEYMVPTAYVPIDALPLTPNGKLDRKRLPEPGEEAYPVAGYEEPVGELETTMAEVWAKALQLDRVGRRDNFFEIGGHSLLAVRVVNLLEQANIQILVVDLFNCATIESLARKVEQAGKQSPAATPILMREAGTGTPLFLVHPSIYGYYARVLAPHIDLTIPVYTVPPKGLGETPARTIEGMAMRMVRLIRSVQSEGPYRIGGYSNGGPLAYEIAAQLLGSDQQVEFLGIIDAYYRGSGTQDTSKFQVEVDEKETLLKILEDACARPEKYVRRVAPEIVEEFTRHAAVMDVAAFLRECQERKVLPLRYDNLTAQQLRQALIHDRTNELADMQYVAQPLPIPVHFFAAQQRDEASIDGWKSIVPPNLLHMHPISGNHQSIMESPNVEGFGRLLSDLMQRASREPAPLPGGDFSPLVGLQVGKRGAVPHFWVPGAGSSVTSFGLLIPRLNQAIPVYGLQPRGLEGTLVPHSSIRAVAECNVAAVNGVHPRGPVHLMGHSFGGWVALEMAHLLMESGREVASLTILDKEAPDQVDDVVREYTHIDILMDWIDGLELLLGRPLGIKRSDLESRTEAAQRQLLHQSMVAANLMPARSTAELLQGPLRTFAASIRAHYKPEKTYPGPLKLVLVDDPRQDESFNRRYHQQLISDWKRFAPNLSPTHGPGNHLTMLKEPHVQELATLIQNL